MPKSKHREDILEILDNKFNDFPNVVIGKMFGSHGYKIEGRFFCMMFADGIALKLSPNGLSECS